MNEDHGLVPIDSNRDASYYWNPVVPHYAASVRDLRQDVHKMIKQEDQLDEKRRRRALELKLEQHTKIFASMCPDEILDHYDNYGTRMYYTTLMLGDVSGFTDLAEKYTKTGKGGPSKLTETLNSYIGAMVQEILSHNGDVLKFSGDAFIVMWKLSNGTMMRDLAIEAMQTACIIQKHFGTYDTEVGVTLRVKLAIASGRTYFTNIGDPETMSHYIITGKPVWDVKFAEGLCRGGDILVAPSSWQWVNPNEYVHETLSDGVHTLIIACTSSWYHSRDDDLPTSTEEEDVDRLDYRGSVFLSKTVVESEAEAIVNLGSNLDTEKFRQIDYTLRPKVVKIAKARLKDVLRSYMLRPVIRSVEMDEPMEYLTEMRQVVILFINVLTSTVGKKTLITLVNSAYKLVCRIVGGMHGCVNKTSLFDKDLMFLCVFGLRGDKHELESQIGLKCAAKVRTGLLSLDNVKSVTVSVTTGMTYCGVVGHILRREYTVIGMSVNKAARLMVAYRDKVVCDRESFLHSHLEARHFILQEPRYLKGITNVGPIYEFQEQPNMTDHVWNKYPLLGREAEIERFHKLLAKLLEHSTTSKSDDTRPKYNTLIIKGEPRIGKTKLLDEFTQNVPLGVHNNYVTLRSDNVKAPYSLILMIFSISLSFSVSTTRKEREDRLLQRLGQVRQTYFLCSLNQPFNVHFPVSRRYNSLTETEKWKILRKFLLKLLKGCFTELWVIIIDDAEYSDIESLQLFDVLTKRDMVFYVLGIGRKLGTEFQIHPNVLRRAKIIELHGIDRWFHAGLACQTLNVSGVPAELEKLIQEKSFGNPGWIESYLVSLLQAGGLEIIMISKHEAIQTGYVLPPLIMLKRYSPSKRSFLTDNERRDRWQMYRSSFKDSMMSLIEENIPRSVHKTQSSTIDETLIAVCKISDKFIYDDVDTEITMDVMILKLFDSLTPLDQLLLKCASVIGETVNRHMLENLMNLSVKKEIGLAIAKLFEIRVFGCATGDFSNYSGPIIFIQNMRNPLSESGIFCNCIGLTIPVELEDLPKYASCGLMRFKMTMFRDTTYRLLTENQKMELHNQALKYLKQYTKRCLSCGEGQFAKLLGKVSKREDRVRRPTVIEEMFGSVEFETMHDVKETENVNSRRWLSCLDMFKSVERSPTVTFSDTDFSGCQCDLILMTVYTQMLDHCRGIGKIEMTMTAILEFAEICLVNSNIPQARKLLVESEEILKQLFQKTEDEIVLLPYLHSKIQTLQGQCYLESGSLFEAENILMTALNNLGYKFPKIEMMIDIKSIEELLKLRWRLKRWDQPEVLDDRLIPEGSITETVDYIEQLAECLAQMFDLFRIKGMKKHARLAAIWGLNTALKTKGNFVVLSTSYANMLITAHMYQDRSIIPSLEEKSLDICRQSRDAIEAQELNMIAQLYAGIFFSRWVNGQITKAIKIGFICCRMAATIGSTFLKLLIMPRLTHLLMLSCRHSEAICQLRELEFESINDQDKSGRTWYYALCADLQLDTGIALLPFKTCEQYYLREGESIISLHDPEAERRYFISMWLWCIRTEQWEASKIWERQSVTERPIMDEHIVAATITALKRLEGSLILYVHKLNSRNTDASTTLSQIKGMFREMKMITKIVKITIPRCLLLKAYYYMIKFQKKIAMKLLKRLKRICLKVENEMIYAWALHLEKVWSGSLSPVKEDRWKEVEEKKLQAWPEINASEPTMLNFTFPLPNDPN
ncbi:adenylate cyclase type 10 [Halictus rubicundus]|uniref:adenylate cyclase type 10 n=1 Tax=Halictus rubicundus TaxID=77578 RepID=UPI0040375856